MSVEPVTEISNEFDVRVANSDVSGRRNTQQRWQDMRDHRIIKTTQTHNRLTPTRSFHPSVAVLPLPFFRSVATVALCTRTELLETSFRIRSDVVTRTLIGCRATAERQK